jgi:hypothetical protein
VVKEYFSEMKTEHAAWQQMPRRMLRHRAMQQCARLAFGITVPECKPSEFLHNKLIPKMNFSESKKLPETRSHCTILKERLSMC